MPAHIGNHSQRVDPQRADLDAGRTRCARPQGFGGNHITVQRTDQFTLFPTGKMRKQIERLRIEISMNILHNRFWGEWFSSFVSGARLFAAAARDTGVKMQKTLARKIHQLSHTDQTSLFDFLDRNRFHPTQVGRFGK